MPSQGRINHFLSMYRILGFGCLVQAQKMRMERFNQLMFFKVTDNVINSSPSVESHYCPSKGYLMELFIFNKTLKTQDHMIFYLKLEGSAQKTEPQPAIEQWLCIITTAYIQSNNFVCGVTLVNSECIFESGLCMYSKLIPPMYRLKKNHFCFLLFEVFCSIIQVTFIVSVQFRYFIFASLHVWLLFRTV